MTDITDFEVVYQEQAIKVQHEKNYRLEFPDGRWLLLSRRPDDTQTVPVENENISYSIASVWLVEDSSGGAEWLTKEEIQVIGELIKRKQVQIGKGKNSDG